MRSVVSAPVSITFILRVIIINISSPFTRKSELNYFCITLWLCQELSTLWEEWHWIDETMDLLFVYVIKELNHLYRPDNESARGNKTQRYSHSSTAFHIMGQDSNEMKVLKMVKISLKF